MLSTMNQTPGFPFQDDWSSVQLGGFCPGLPVCPKHSHEPPDKMSGLVRVGNIPHIVICDHELHSRVFLFVLWTNTCCLNWQPWYEQALIEQSSFLWKFKGVFYWTDTESRNKCELAILLWTYVMKKCIK